MQPEIISSISLFVDVQEQTIKSTMQHARTVFYEKDAVIYDSNSNHEKLFFYVIKGWVKLFNVSSEGVETIIDILTDTHHFNEDLVFEDVNEPCSAQAINNLQVMTLPIALLRQLVHQDHQLAINLLKESMQKQRKLNHDIGYLFIRRASQRIGYFLLRLCNQDETKNLTLRLPYHKSLLATRLGMRPETFSRALAKLCQHCNISVEDEIVRISFLEELERYVGKDRSQRSEIRSQ